MRERKQLEFEDSGYENSAWNEYRVKEKFYYLLLTVDLTAPFSIVFFRTRVEELVTPFAQVRIFFPLFKG